MSTQEWQTIYHARPYSIEARATLPLLQALIVALAALLIILPLSVYTTPQADGVGDWFGLALPRAGTAVVLSLIIGGAVLAILILRATRPDVAQYIMPADLDRDGEIDEEELSAAEYLFTENGLVEFAERVFFGTRDWRAETLIPDPLSREMYDVLLARGGVYRTVGVLDDPGRGHTPNLLAGSPAEAERMVREYLNRRQRKVWTLAIQAKGGIVRVSV